MDVRSVVFHGVDGFFEIITEIRFISVVVITLDFDYHLPATPVRTRDGPPFFCPQRTD